MSKAKKCLASVAHLAGIVLIFFFFIDSQRIIIFVYVYVSHC